MHLQVNSIGAALSGSKHRPAAVSRPARRRGTRGLRVPGRDTGSGGARTVERQCVGCGGRATPSDLLRFALGLENEIVVDLGRKNFGRGVWCHPRVECVSRAAKGGLSKGFKTHVRVSTQELLDGIGLAANRRILSLLSAARARGSLIFGGDAVREQRDKVAAFLLATDAQAVARASWLNDEVVRGRVCRWADKEQYGALFGRAEVGLVGVCDAGIANAVLNAIGLAQLALAEGRGNQMLAEVR